MKKLLLTHLAVGDSTGTLRTQTYGQGEYFQAQVHRRRSNGGATEIYRTVAGNAGSITITRAESLQTGIYKAIVSGRFDFTATSETTGETIRVTDGRFDVKVF